jgi:hypothetical protein
MSAVEYPAYLFRKVRIDIGFQQSELHKIELRAAAANAFEFACDRIKRLNCGGEIAPFERRKAARHGRNERTRWITTLTCEAVDLLYPLL